MSATVRGAACVGARRTRPICSDVVRSVVCEGFPAAVDPMSRQGMFHARERIVVDQAIPGFTQIADIRRGRAVAIDQTIPVFTQVADMRLVGDHLFYFEVQLTQVGGLSELLLGVAGAASLLTDPIDTAVNGTAPSQADCAVVSAAPQSAPGTTVGWGYPSRSSTGGSNTSVGDWIGVALDTLTNQLWMRNVTVGDAWQGDGSGLEDPAAGVHGFDIGTQITGDYYITVGTAKNWFDGDTTSSIVTLNAGGSAFVAAAPSGFVSWGSAGATTLNPADKDSRITLSGGNLVATTTMSSPFGTPPFSHTAMVRSTTSKAR